MANKAPRDGVFELTDEYGRRHRYRAQAGSVLPPGAEMIEESDSPDLERDEPAAVKRRRGPAAQQARRGPSTTTEAAGPAETAAFVPADLEPAEGTD